MPTSSSPKSLVSLKTEFVVIFFLGLELLCLLVLAGQWGTARVLVTPGYLLILPGAALILLVKNDLDNLVEFVLKSFLLSILIIFVIKTAVWYFKFDELTSIGQFPFGPTQSWLQH